MLKKDFKRPPKSHFRMQTINGMPRPGINVEQLVSQILELRGPTPLPPEKSNIPGDWGNIGEVIEEPSSLGPSPNLQPVRVIVELEPEFSRTRSDDVIVPPSLSNLPYDVEPLFPGADRSEQVFKLANYFVVTMPFTRRTMRGLVQRM